MKKVRHRKDYIFHKEAANKI